MVRGFSKYAHDDLERVARALADGAQARGVLKGGVHVVHTARTDDDEDAVILAVDDAVHGAARLVHQPLDLRRAGELAHEVHGRRKLFDLPNANVVNRIAFHGVHHSV